MILLTLKTCASFAKIGSPLKNGIVKIVTSPSFYRVSNNFGTSLSVCKEMSHFVIGVSGVTCGGKTTLSKLLQKSFPWCRVIHQDTYFYEDDSENHIRLGPELQNHANYELITSLNMDQMCKDVDAILEGPGTFSKLTNQAVDNTPNFETGHELLKSVGEIGKIWNGFDWKMLFDLLL